MLPRTFARSTRSIAALLARPALAPRVASGSPVIRAIPARASLARAYSAAAKLKEADEDDFLIQVQPKAESKPEPINATSAPSAEAESTPEPINATPAPSAEVAEDDFFGDIAAESSERRAPRRQEGRAVAEESSSPDSPTGSSVPQTDKVPFLSLKGRMNYDTLKSVTFKPFNFTSMSEVQKRVLAKMPELAGGKTQQKLIDVEDEAQRAARLVREENGREDLLVKAKTGTGKTIAFLIPAIDARLQQLDRLVAEAQKDPSCKDPGPHSRGRQLRELTRSHVGALIISPTRELAQQIANEAEKLCTWHKDFKVQLLVGGNSRHFQLKDWKSMRNGRKDIVVATPGRLIDMLNEPEVAEAIAHTDTLVLDEADTLLEFGFKQELDQILKHLPKERQTFLFSATVSREIKKIARDFLKPKHDLIDCVPKNESNVHLHIPQYSTVLESGSDQLAHIMRLLAHDQLVNKGSSKAIVFLPTTKQTMLFATLLREMSRSLPDGLSVHEIHSRLQQERRSRANERFRQDRRASVLVTSDVSARGVDYPGVTRVIQVGIPSNTDQYVHRVGRTGRGGKTGGRGDIVLLPWEKDFLRELDRISVPMQEVTVADLENDVNRLAAGKRSEPKIASLKEDIHQLLPNLDPEAVNDVFGSLMGYYMSKTDVVGKSNHEIHEGLKAWATEAGGLPNPPRLSPRFLQIFGLLKNSKPGRSGGGGGGGNGGSRKKFGMRSGDNDRSDRYDRNDRSDRNDRNDRFPRERNDRFPRDRNDGASRFPRHDRNDRSSGFSRDRSSSFSGSGSPRFGDRSDRNDRPRSWGNDRGESSESPF